MATSNKYGIVKYGEGKYGINVRAEEICPLETILSAIKHNDITHLFLELNDSIEITEGINTSFGYNIFLHESIDISTYGRVFYGDHIPFSEHPSYGGDIEFSIGYFQELSEYVDIEITYFSTNLSGVSNSCLGLKDSITFNDSIVVSQGFKLSLEDSMSILEEMSISYGWCIFPLDSISISENMGNNTALRLSDSISIDVSLLEIVKAEGVSLTTGWKFLIRDSSGNYLASLVNARSRWFKEALNHGGSAGFILDPTDENCNSTILATNQNELIIQYKGYDMFGGQISSVRKVAEGNSRYWEVTAIQFFNLLEQRFCGYNKSTGLSDIREFTTTDAGTIAWTLIDESQDEVNGDLGITQGTLQASLNRTKSYEKKNIAEAIVELADNDYGFDFEITTDKVFNVYYPMKGTVRDEVVFRYPGNCLSFDCLENGLDVVNHELGLGRHWGGQEIYYVVDDVTSQAAYGRREKIDSYKDVEIQAFLNDMVTEDIAWNKDIHQVVKFKSFIDDKSDLYMYELGDTVRVVADDFNVNEQLFVYERQVAIDEGDTATVTLTLGD
jgi:hypothetical protein